VARLEKHPQQTIVAQSIITLAHQLGKSLIAEGVETEAQLELVRQLGCDFIQGHWYSEAVDEKAAFALLMEQLSGSVSLL